MLVKTIPYKDFNGKERKETFFFNLEANEITKLELSVPGGFRAMIRKLVEQQNVPEIAEVFTQVIDASYGIKSEDGKYFRKTPEALFDFKSTRAYNVLFMELVGDPKAAIEFFKGIIPDREEYKRDTSEFIKIRGVTAELEHSLISLSRWEQQWLKPFPLIQPTNGETQVEINGLELFDYIKCMLLKPISEKNAEWLMQNKRQEIVDYILKPRTASTYSNNAPDKSRRGRSVMSKTSELLYAYLIENHAEISVIEKWHLSRVEMLITILSVRAREANGTAPKMSKNEFAAYNKAQRERYRAMHAAKGHK